MSLLFNMLSRLVISSKEQAPFNFMAAVSICSDFGAPQNEVSLFPHLLAMKWWDQMPVLVFWMLSFKPTFSLSSFTFIKRLFNSSLLSAISVVSSAYLRLLIFLPAILIPACASSSPAFPMLYSAYKLNKQADNIQPWQTPFPIWNQSVVPCPALTAQYATGDQWRNNFIKNEESEPKQKQHLAVDVTGDGSKVHHFTVNNNTA